MATTQTQTDATFLSRTTARGDDGELYNLVNFGPGRGCGWKRASDGAMFTTIAQTRISLYLRPTEKGTER